MLIPCAATQIGLRARQMGKGALPLLWRDKFSRRSDEERFSYGMRTFDVVISILVRALSVILAQEEVASEANIK